MPLRTTVIGSYPKPSYLDMPDMFRMGDEATHVVERVNEYMEGIDNDEEKKKEFEATVERATKEVVQEQIDLGLDCVTDGEVHRENYIFHFCRLMDGFDFKQLTSKTIRNGAFVFNTGTVTGPLSLHADRIEEEVAHWRKVQSWSDKPVKFTIPGPLTIVFTSADVYYNDVEALCRVLSECINQLVLALDKAGCRYIQMDEPVLVRQPEAAMSYAINNLSRCFQGASKEVTRCIHLCCGYPAYLDQKDYLKASPDIYLQLAEKLDKAGFDEISIENAHRRNETKLFQMFKRSKLVLGVIEVASSRVESKEEIRKHVNEVLQHIPASRLILAPDCGLAYLPKNVLHQKIQNMTDVARSV